MRMRYFVLHILLVSLVALPNVGQAALSDFFVGTEWLEARRQLAIIVDVRNARSYQKGHIAGAYLVARSQFMQTRNRVNNMLPDAAVMTELLSSLGATAKDILVVYAEDDSPFAARLVWSLRYYGHKNSYVLDGGYEKWFAESRETSQQPSANRDPIRYQVKADADSRRTAADADYIYRRLENPEVVVWDARSPGEHAGTDVRAARGGHIPGAVPLNWVNLQTKVDGVKVLKSRDEILTLLQTHGITADKEIVAHCQTGVRSAYATLVLLGLGYEKVRNYDGSWIEWANNAALPIINAQGEPESSGSDSKRSDVPIESSPPAIPQIK